MEKIEFKDLPDTTTPFTASLFNEMQDNVEEAIDLTNTYSNDEIVIGTWLGKPLYRKVIDFGALPDTTSKKVNTNLSNVKIVRLYGYAVALNNTTIPLPYATASANFIVSLNYTSDDKINIETGADRTEYSGYVVIEYTKTTD